MSKILLLHTIGNSDWQFSGNNIFEVFSKQFCEENPELGAALMKKIGKKTFRDSCVDIWNEMKADTWIGKHAKEIQRFPILEAVCEFVLQKEGKIDELVPFYIQQPEPWHTDTDEISEPLAAYFRYQYSEKDKIMTISNKFGSYPPIQEDSLERAIAYFDDFLQKREAEGYDKIYISCVTGLPLVSFALRVVGLFKRYIYLNPHAQQGVQIQSQQIIENYISKQFR